MIPDNNNPQWPTFRESRGNARLIGGAPTSSGDYHLQSGSDCIDEGTGTGAPSDDIDGDSRSGSIDMGADEYVP